jgi:hypothetical protein
VAERQHLNEHRHALGRQASALYEGVDQMAGLLVRADWLAATPLPLEDIRLVWADSVEAPAVDGTGPEEAALRAGFPTYTAAMASLAPPTVFENRPCYRLVDVAGTSLTFGRARFFDGLDVCEAVAHELARGGEPALRRQVGDPFDLGRRTVIAAASVLTIRSSRTDGPTIVLHRRDAAKVAHGGGLHQVVPVGVFQPTSDDPRAWTGDFDLWRSIVREYSEELLGTAEVGQAGDGPVDYDSWPFHQALADARHTGDLRVFWLGLGMDPLSLVTDFLVVAVFEEELFDHLFGDLVVSNAEGEIVADVPLPAADHLRRHPMQPAGAALLHLAGTHRDRLLARS